LTPRTKFSGQFYLDQRGEFRDADRDRGAFVGSVDDKERFGKTGAFPEELFHQVGHEGRAAAQRRAGGDNGLEGIRGDRQGVEGEKAGVGAAKKGKVVEIREEFGRLGTMQQLGMELKPKEVKK